MMGAEAVPCCRQRQCHDGDRDSAMMGSEAVSLCRQRQCHDGAEAVP